MQSQLEFDWLDIHKERATILAVDDSVSSAQLVKIQLQLDGYQVILAHSGEEALAKVDAELPDLIILDVMMPGLDGFDVCRRLKADRRTWFIPIILVTALSQLEDRIEGLDAGADDFLSKPFNREELLARVRALLRLRSAYDALQIERNRLALLYNISQEINSRLALDEVLSKIVTLTREALAANMCSIIIQDEAQDTAHQIISREGRPPGVASKVSPAVFQAGLAGWVQRHQESTIVQDTTQDRRWLVLPGDTEPVGSAIAAPLVVGQEIIGVLLLTHTLPNFFDESHLTVLTSIASQAAVTVRNAQLYEVEQQRRRELELLQAAGVAVSAELNWKALMDLIVRQAAYLLNLPAASLMLWDETDGQLALESWHGLSDNDIDFEQVPFIQVPPPLKDGERSFQIPDLRQQPEGHAYLVARDDLVSQLSLALVTLGKFMGLLNLYSQDEPLRFNLEEVKLAETFAQQAAIALDNARLLERTREERGKLSAVLSSTTDAVLSIDEEGNLLLANPAAERTFGLNAAQLMNKPLTSHIPPQLLELFERVAQSGEPVSLEIAAEQGQTLYASVAPVVGVGQVSVVQNITPLKELEAMRLRAEQEERERIHQLFARYVSPELVDRILAQEAGLLERRERRDVVVLFADLRRFSDMTVALPAPAAIKVLNEFFTAMVDIVYKHQGTVFDLAGDELMVGFGAPFDQDDAAERALNVAGDMQKAFGYLRQRWKKERGIKIGLGVGLDRGTVVMGSIGSSSHMNFGLVGDAVNTAHRLVEMARHGEIVVSEAVVEALGEKLEGWTFKGLPPVEIRHKSAPLQVYLAQPRRKRFF